jgi:hypothetical protein
MRQERVEEKRFIVNLNAKFMINDMSVTGNLENLSETGAYVKIKNSNIDVGFTSGTKLKIEFCLPSEEKLILNCELIWLFNSSDIDLQKSIGVEPLQPYVSIGMKIINPSVIYREFLKTLE